MHLEVRVDRVPALVHHRTDQILREEMLEQLGDHLRRQIINSGAWQAHFMGEDTSVCGRIVKRQLNWIKFDQNTGEEVANDFAIRNFQNKKY